MTISRYLAAALGALAAGPALGQALPPGPTGCRIGHVVENRPMTVTRPSAADTETLRASLRTAVLPAWVKRCGEAYNRLVAPIAGVRYEAC